MGNFLGRKITLKKRSIPQSHKTGGLNKIIRKACFLDVFFIVNKR